MKLRVLFVTGSNGMRGANRSLMESLRLAFCAEFECVVATPPDDGPSIPVLAEMGVKVLRCDQPYWVTGSSVDHWLLCMRRLPAAVHQMQAIIRNERIDVVYTNAGQTPVGALAAARERKPHVWHVRECYLNPATGLASPAGQPALAAAIGELANILIVASHHLAAEYRPYMNPEKIRAIYEGVDAGAFATLPVSVATRSIICLGTTSVAKGLDDLIDAAALLNQQNTVFEINVLGDFDDRVYKRRVDRRLQQLHMADHFHLRGWHSDPAVWIGQAAILCAPSHAESFCRAVAEGMMAGRAVVATRCGGPEELVLDGQTGYLVPTQDPPALAKALGSLLQNPVQSRDMGAQGRQRALQLFDAQNAARCLAAVIREAVEKFETTQPATGMADTLLTFLELAGRRLLLGKKWALLSRLFNSVGRPI